VTTPAKFDPEIYQGDSWDLFFRVKARDAGGNLVYQDLTGSTAKAQFRVAASATTILAELTCTLSDQVATTGGVLVRLSPAQSAGLVPGNAKWDCEISYPNGDKRTVLAGDVTVTAEVTRV
jgi:hypothetical protein